MKTRVECIPCFFQQALKVCQYSGVDESTAREVLHKMTGWLRDLSLDQPPAEIGTVFHRKVRQALQCHDPFADIKQQSNAQALPLLPDLREAVQKAADPLECALRISAAGNILDFSLNTQIQADQVFKKVDEEKFAICQIEPFLRELESCHKVLYLTDNSGEIVFDIPFIELLQSRGKEVVVGVKGGPALNDATMEDALQVGLPGICQVISNGNDGIGTILSLCSEEFRRVFDRSDLILSKGQANFETLVGNREKKIFFLFKAKCAAIEKELGVPKWALLFIQGE